MSLGLDRAENWEETVFTFQGDDGGLRGEMAVGGSVTEMDLVFYRDEYVLVEQDDGASPGSRRANFVRDAEGRVAWFSSSGRLYGRQA